MMNHHHHHPHPHPTSHNRQPHSNMTRLSVLVQKEKRKETISSSPSFFHFSLFSLFTSS